MITEEQGQLQKACIEIQKVSMEEGDNVLSGAKDRLSGKLPAGFAGKESFLFEVPFNPSELSFERQNGRKDKKKNWQRSEEENIGQTYLCQAVTPDIVMKVKLIFDRTVYEDDSVQQEVEGFLATARDPAARFVNFQWKEVQFQGILTSVSAQYQMFSPLGNPMRASVELSITGQKNQTELLAKDYQKMLGY